jgi:hypothetical protein
MVRVAGALVVLLVAGFPAAAPPPAPIMAATAPVCFSTGAITYQLAPTTVAADYRVKIAPAAADLRIELVDEVETADFALVDDGAAESAPADDACDSGGTVKTVQAVDESAPADVTVSLARAGTSGDGAPPLKLFVHSTRFAARDAAALLAAMRHDQAAAPRS